jgi:hypothetical protein
MTTGAPDIPESWEVTSDSLAVWLARKLGVSRVLLVKSAVLPTETASVVGLAKAGIVDPLLPRFLAGSGIECRCIEAAGAADFAAALAVGASPVRCSAAMTEHILFVTGHLAKPRLTKLLAHMAPADFTYEIVDIGVKVAALMTGQILRRRLPAPIKADRVLLPGRFRGDLEALAGYYGRPVQRGPEDLQDLAEFFGRKGPPPDLSRQNVRIFAELVEAPSLSVEAILERAALYRRTAPMSSISAACRIPPFPISKPRPPLWWRQVSPSASIPPMSMSFAAVPRRVPAIC